MCHTTWKRTSTYELWKSWGKWLHAWFEFANHVTLTTYFLSYEKQMKGYNCLFKAQGPYSICHFDLGQFGTSIHLWLATLSYLLTLIGTLVFERYVLKCGSKNGHQKDLCLKETEQVHAQNLMLILGSTINIDWGDLHDRSMRKRMFTLIVNEVFIHITSNTLWRKWIWKWFQFANHLALIACFYILWVVAGSKFKSSS